MSNFVDTYSSSKAQVINEVASILYDGNDTSVDIVSELANVSGDKENVFKAVQESLGFDGIEVKDFQETGNPIYIPWLPNQIKSIENRGTFATDDDNIYYQSAEYQQAAAVVDNATMPNTANSFDGAREILNKIVGKPLTNSTSGLEGTISGNSIDKILSGKASRQSTNLHAHFFASANIEKLFEQAQILENPEKGNRQGIKFMHRLYAPFIYNNDVLVAKISLKEFESRTDNRIYSIEAIDVEKPMGNLAPKQSEKNLTGRPAQASIPQEVISLVEEVKRAQGVLFQGKQPQTTPDTARGAFVQRPLDGQAMIALFKGKKDISTVIHEGAGYMFLENLREAASLETYSPI